MAQAIRTIDHEEIKEWSETRGGSPAVVEGTYDEFGSGILRVDFGDGDESLEPLSWEEFFRIFDENDLAFIYREEPDGAESYFCKFVARNEDAVDLEAADATLELDEGDVSDSF